MSNTTFKGVNVATASLSQLYTIEDEIIDAIDVSGYGLVRLKAGNVYVTPNSFLAPTTDDTGAIQRTVDAASSGDTVNVEAGTYLGDVNVAKPLSIVGAGSDTSGSVMSISSGNGLTIAADNVSVSGLRISGTGSTDGIYFNSAVANASLSNVVSTGNSIDMEVHNSAVLSNLSLNQVSLINSPVGFRVGTTGVVHGMTVTSSHFDNDDYGLEVFAASSSTANQNDFTNIQISNSTFNTDKFKGLYAEKLNNATLNNVTVTGSGYGTSSPNGINLNLKYGTYTGITIKNSTFTSDATGVSTSAAVSIDGRNDAPSYHANPASISGVTLSNDTFSGTSPVDLAISDNVTGVTLSGVQLGGSGVGFVSADTAGGINLGDTQFAGTLSTYIANFSPFTLDASQGATFNGFDTGTGSVPSDLASYYAIEDKIVDGIDKSGLGLVRLKTGNVFVTPNSFYTAGGTTAASIQRGVDAASNGDTVNVEAGTYSRAGAGDSVLDINKGVTVLGTSGPVSTTIDGNSTGENYYVVKITASNATLSGFTVTNPTYAGSADASGVLVESSTPDHLSGDRVTNNIIHDLGAATRPAGLAMGINVEEGNDGLEIDHNTIYNIGVADPSGFAIGILTAGDPGQEVDGANIHDNTIYNISNPGLAAGIDAGSSSQNITIQGNTIGASGSVGDGIRVGSVLRVASISPETRSAMRPSPLSI